MFYLVAFSTGLISSLHCVGMCGPLALALPVGKLTKKQHLPAKLLYNIGRISTYAFLGLIFGILGEKLNLFNLQQKLSIVSGFIILFFVFRDKFEPLRFINQYIKNKFSRLLSFQNPHNFYILGIINGFLPCSMIYLALSGAVVSADGFRGMLYMIFFGLGTTPALLFVQQFLNYIKTKNSIFLRKHTSTLASAIALLLIIRGLNLGIPYLSPQVSENHENPITVCHGK